MTKTRYLKHATVQTSDVTPIWRWQIADHAIDHLLASLDSALTGGRPVVIDDVEMTAEQQGRNMTATLWRNDTPVLTVAVCLKSQTAPRLWRAMHESATPPARPDQGRRPAAPWILSRLEPGIRRDDALWTGDFANCLGHAWLEYAR